jgi:uncharacterized protein YjbJ (UPF0337 family)
VHRRQISERSQFTGRRAELFRHSCIALCLQGKGVDFPSLKDKEDDMDKDRIQGSVQQAKGKVKEVAGKVAGDAKLEAEGKSDKAGGKIQNAVGGVKDKLRGKQDR